MMFMSSSPSVMTATDLRLRLEAGATSIQSSENTSNSHSTINNKSKTKYPNTTKPKRVKPTKRDATQFNATKLNQNNSCDNVY